MLQWASYYTKWPPEWLSSTLQYHSAVRQNAALQLHVATNDFDLVTCVFLPLTQGWTALGGCDDVTVHHLFVICEMKNEFI